MDVLHSVPELIQAVGPTYGAIDIRAVAIPGEKDSWTSVMAVLRLTYEDAQTARSRIEALSARYLPVQEDSLRIALAARPFSEWADIVSELKNGVLNIGNLELKLRHSRDLSEARGYIQRDAIEIRSFDRRDWPVMRITFDVGGPPPLIEARLNQVVHLLGYADVFEAVTDLCEVNVSVQNPGHDFSICVPVFATVTEMRAKMADKTVDVVVARHKRLSQIWAVACIRGQTALVDQPFRQQKTISEFSTNADSEIVTVNTSVQFEKLDSNDWVEVRLLHRKIGEIRRDSSPVRMLISLTERNILLAALRRFCSDEELEKILTDAANTKAPRLNESAAFELHVSWLLALFGFSTVVLRRYEHIVAPQTKVQKASVDILAARQRGELLLLVACTLNPPKPEDFGNLRYAREIMVREIFPDGNIRVIPVLFTAAVGCDSYDGEVFDFVPIVDADNIANLLRFLRMGQERRFFEFLANPNYSHLSESNQP